MPTVVRTTFAMSGIAESTSAVALRTILPRARAAMPLMNSTDRDHKIGQPE
jgi:hypothetical protein